MRSTSSFVLGLLAACGTDDGEDAPVDCATVTNDDTFVVGLEKAGRNGVLDFRMMSATPAPPARGFNTWVFQINSMSSGVVGAPVDGASLTVSPYMPLHGHYAGVDVEITPMTDPGQYKLEPVNLWMGDGAIWETTIRAVNGTTSDSVVYTFCIP